MTANGPHPTPSDRSRPPALTRWERWLLAGLLVFTLVVRGAVLWGMRGNLEQDPDAYREIAEFLLQRGEFALGKLSPLEGASRPVATAYRPPLYPVVLSNLPAADGQQISLTKVAALHLLLGVGTVWLTWLTVRKVGLSRREGQMLKKGGTPVADTVGQATSHELQVARGMSHLPSLLAGLIVACDPILLNQQALVMTETLATFLAILTLWCLARFDSDRSSFNAAMAGGASGLAVLCRPTFLPWVGLVAVGLIFVRGGRQVQHASKAHYHLLADFGWRATHFAGFVLTAAGVMSPWAIRNYREFGKPLLTTTHGGFTFYLGNNGTFYDWLDNDRSGVPWDSRFFQNRLWGQWDTTVASFGRKEFDFDEWCYKKARQEIQGRPEMFVRACVYRVGQLWSPLPNKLKADESMGRRLLRYGTCAWHCSVYLLAVIGVWRLRWKMIQPPWVWGVLLCLVFTAVHTFYWSNLRMRAPLMPFVALVAAAAVISKKES